MWVKVCLRDTDITCFLPRLLGFSLQSIVGGFTCPGLWRANPPFTVIFQYVRPQSVMHSFPIGL